MGMVRNYDLFTPRWQNGLLIRGGSGFNCELKIYTATVTNNNGEMVIVETALYTGKARFQPLNLGARKDTPGSQAIVQAARISVPVKSVEAVVFLPGQFIAVTACTLIPGLVGMTFVLRDTTDSGNAIERTLMVENNMVRPA